MKCQKNLERKEKQKTAKGRWTGEEKGGVGKSVPYWKEICRADEETGRRTIEKTPLLRKGTERRECRNRPKHKGQ